MFAAVLALCAAVVVTVAYRVLTEQLDYASIRRRQLDVWAAAAAIACFGLIVYGNASTRRVSPPVLPVDDRLPAESAPEPVRRNVPAVPVMAPEPVVVPAEQAPLVIEPSSSESVAAVGPDAAPNRYESSDQDTSPQNDSPPVIRLGSQAPTTTAVTPPQFIAPPSPTASIRLPRPPAPSPTTRRPVPIVPSPTTEPLPTPAPSATPNCGDPNDIRIVVTNLDTEREDLGSDIVVSYTIGLRNDSAFPVTVAKMRVTVARLGGGSEEFASQSLDDVTIEPGALWPIEKRITLETRPPPVGEVNLCLTYRAETCNRGLPSGGSRCQIVDGF